MPVYNNCNVSRFWNKKPAKGEEMKATVYGLVVPQL